MNGIVHSVRDKKHALHVYIARQTLTHITPAYMHLYAGVISSKMIPFYWLKIITVLYERWGVTFHPQIDCLFNNLSTLSTPRLCIVGPLWGDSSGDRWIPPQSVSVMSSLWVSSRKHQSVRIVTRWVRILQRHVSVIALHITDRSTAHSTICSG